MKPAPGPRTSPASALAASWHDNAAAWTRAVRDGAIESRQVATDAAMLDAIAALNPKQVLDLGCGEGWLVRALAACGIAAVGVDGSAPLIEAARAAGGGRFECLTYAEIAADPARLGTGFDVVAANFALMEEDLAPLLGALRHVMAAEAALLIQTLHPLAAAAPYADGWRSEDFRGFGEGAWTPMPWYFRTLESWMAALTAGGFTLTGLVEPRHPEDGRLLSLLLTGRPQG